MNATRKKEAEAAAKEFDAFKKAWEGYPSQDNEGFVPDRGGFKCGWFAALQWSDENPKQSVSGSDEELAEKYAQENCAVQDSDGSAMPDQYLYEVLKTHYPKIVASLRSEMNARIEEAARKEKERICAKLQLASDHWKKVGSHPAWGGPLTEDHMNPQEYAALILSNIRKVIINPENDETNDG